MYLFSICCFQYWCYVILTYLLFYILLSLLLPGPPLLVWPVFSFTVCQTFFAAKAKYCFHMHSRPRTQPTPTPYKQHMQFSMHKTQYIHDTVSTRQVYTLHTCRQI